jgi:hypothetical protein
MADISDATWNDVDANNNAAPPAGWPEGQMPSTVNDCARADKGSLKRFWNRINPVQSITSSAIVTPPGTLWLFNTGNTAYPTAYQNGEIYFFKAAGAAGGGDVFQVNTLAQKPIQRLTATGAVATVAGDWPAGWRVALVYDSAAAAGAGAFMLLNPPIRDNGSGGALFAHGVTINSGGDAPPANTGTAQSAGLAARFTDAVAATLDLGVNGTTNGVWLQSTNITDLSQHYPLALNPNGGAVSTGGAATVGGALTVTGAATLNGTGTALSIPGGNVSVTGDIAATTLHLTGTLTGVGATFSGALSAASLSCTGNCTVSGSQTITGDLTVNGGGTALNVPSGNLTLGGSQTVGGNLTINGGGTSFQIPAGGLSVAGGSTFGQGLTVGGLLTVSGGGTSLQIPGGSASIAGNVTAAQGFIQTGTQGNTLGGTLQINGGGTALNVPSGNISGGGTATFAGICYAAQFQVVSDARLKRNIKDAAADCLKAVRGLHLVSYDVDRHIDVGLIAQDVRKFMPSAVTDDEDGLLRVDLLPLVSYLVGAVQQLHARVAELEGAR